MSIISSLLQHCCTTVVLNFFILLTHSSRVAFLCLTSQRSVRTRTRSRVSADVCRNDTNACAYALCIRWIEHAHARAFMLNNDYACGHMMPTKETAGTAFVCCRRGFVHCVCFVSIFLVLGRRACDETHAAAQWQKVRSEKRNVYLQAEWMSSTSLNRFVMLFCLHIMSNYRAIYKGLDPFHLTLYYTIIKH